MVLDIGNSCSAFVYKKTGTRLAASLFSRTYLSALRADLRIVGEVEVVRSRAVEANPTLHDRTVRMAWVDRNG